MKKTRIAVSVLVAGLALSACGQPASPPRPEQEAPTVSATPAQPDPAGTSGAPAPTPTAGTPLPPPTTGAGKPGPSGPTTISGTVTAGVEPNCLLLGGYLLIGGPPEVVRSGARVSVTGRPSPGMPTTCQQGVPFLVDSARAA
jgi:hypothetical protein